MDNRPAFERRPELTADIDPIQLFPFMPGPGWYHEYWYYEREPSRVRRLVYRVFRLSVSAAMATIARILRNRSEPHQQRSPLALH